MGKIKDLLNKIASSFQPAYDKIDAWDLPPNIKKSLNEIWDLLSPSLQSSIFQFITKIYKEYGPEVGAKILASIIKEIKKWINIE